MTVRADKEAYAGRAGFTLVELMVAITILMIFGGMAATALNYGTKLWRSGHRRSYAYDAASVIFQQLQDDLGGAKSQFWNTDADAYDDRVRFVVDPDSQRRQRLRFVRGIPDDTVNPRLRQAGDGVNNDPGNDSETDEEVYDLFDNDDDDNIDEDLMPLEGLCEIAYLMGLGAEDYRTLYRAVRSPIGGSGSLFVSNNINHETEIRESSRPVAQNVLYFEVRLWDQYTTSWRHAQPTWDSDGPSDDPLDNAYPRLVMAVVVIVPPENLRAPNPMHLSDDIQSAARIIPVSGSPPPHNTAWPHLLIVDPDAGNEWVRYTRYDPEINSFVLDTDDRLAKRGARRTKRVAHNAVGPGGARRRVLLGYTFSCVFYNPAGREVLTVE